MEHESRLQEAEIKLAFLEKELGESKDALHELHARLTQAEGAVRALQAREADPGAGDQPGEGDFTPGAAEDSGTS